MKKYTQRELCYEAFGDIMRGLGNVAKAGAKLAVPAGADLVNRGKAAVNTFTQQQPVKAIIEFFKDVNSRSRYVQVYSRSVSITDIVLNTVPTPPRPAPGATRAPDPSRNNYRLTEPTAFKELKKYANILLVDFEAKNYETNKREKFIAYLVKDESGKVGYTVFAIQESIGASAPVSRDTAIDPDEILPPEERRRPSPIAIKGPVAPKTRLAGPTVPRIYDRAAIDV